MPSDRQGRRLRLSLRVARSWHRKHVKRVENAVGSTQSALDLVMETPTWSNYIALAYAARMAQQRLRRILDDRPRDEGQRWGADDLVVIAGILGDMTVAAKSAAKENPTALTADVLVATAEFITAVAHVTGYLHALDQLVEENRKKPSRPDALPLTEPDEPPLSESG